jgi:hypothetical protein
VPVRGEVTETVGGVFNPLTVMLTGGEVFVAPLLSVATAVIEYVPAENPVETP